MAIWKVTTDGTFYRQIPAGMTVDVLDVRLISNFKPSLQPSSPIPVTLEVEVGSVSGEQAIKDGLALFERASGAARLSAGSAFDYNANASATQTGTTTSSGIITCRAEVTIMQTPVSQSDEARMGLVKQHWSTYQPHEQRVIGFALRWFDRSLRGTDPTDQLIAAWIGFETLIDEGAAIKQPVLDRFLGRFGYRHVLKSDAVRNGAKRLKVIYPGVSTRKLKRGIAAVYSARNKIFHEAELDLADVAVKAAQARAMLTDVLLALLGLAPQHRCSQYF